MFYFVEFYDELMYRDIGKSLYLKITLEWINL